jgi:Putative porin
MTILERAARLCALALAVAAQPASAQDLLSAPQDAPISSWSWFGDLDLREDHVSGLPNGRDDLQRVRARFRAGTNYALMPTLDFGAAIKLAAGSDDNRTNRSNNDNERSDGAALDQLYLRWHPGDTTSLLLGKTPFPLALSPMLWDTDLRPIGLSIDHSMSVGDFNRLQFIGGYFAGNHLYDDDSRIGAVQAGWHWHEGAPSSASVLLSYLHFSDLQQLVTQGLARTNRRVGTVLISDYHLLDLQLIGRIHLGSWPLEARLDLVRNQGADDQNEGARASVVLGDSRQAHSWEFGLARQRIQRDAVMAAFNADDWWFHSFTEGTMPWIAYGLDGTWSVRLAGFHELRDGLNEHTDRILLDVFARW